LCSITRDGQKATFSGILGYGRIVKNQLDAAIGAKINLRKYPFTDSDMLPYR
jgi:hypothetical protein